MSVLAERLLAVHAALHEARLRHAFGGAIALAYCTLEPRGTRDLDVNVFVGVERSDEVLDALPEGVAVGRKDRAAARSEGQVRVMWGDTPIDIFLSTHDFHDEAAARVLAVPFEHKTIPVLDCVSLLVFKALFNRTRDWADIEAMIEAAAVDTAAALGMLCSLMGADHPAVARLARLLSG